MRMSVTAGWTPPTGDGLSAIAGLRARLWDAGFRPLAVFNAHTGRPSAGKAPKGEQWQIRARLNPPEAAVSPCDPDAVNTGILCDGLRAVDIDVDDRALANQIKLAALNRFGETAIRYRSNSGRTLLLYRAAEGEPEKRVLAGTKGKVEILGKGQQFVAFGRHDSGADLHWLTEAPGDMTIDQLPAITEEDVTKLLRFAETVIDAKPESHKNGTGAVSVQGLVAADALQVVAAVCGIPNDGPADWEAFNRIGMAIWSSTAGSEVGRAAFHAWAQQHPSYDEAETSARWAHYRTSPPTRIGAGTLFHLARHASQETQDSYVDDVPPPQDDEQANWEPAAHVEPQQLARKPLVEENERPALYVLKTGWVEKEIPKRPWVAPGYLLRGSVTVLSGPGSAGKSSLVVAWTAAHAMGVEFGRFRSMDGAPLRAMTYNVEDDREEQQRRYSGICRQLNTKTSALMQNLTICGPEDVGTLLSLNREGGVLVNTRAMQDLIQLIGDIKPDVIWLDPFVELHGAEENDNTAVRTVLARFRQLARDNKMAIGILHHARKGVATPGDPDSIRGASAIVGAGRIALTVNVMTDEEAASMSIMKEHRRDYFRLDDAKKNYSRVEDAEWFERVEYELDNGDFVAVPKPWFPPAITLSQDTMLQLEHIVGEGSSFGPWSPRLSDDPRSIATALTRLNIEGKVKQRQALTQVKASGAVVVAAFQKPGKSRQEPTQGLRTRDGKPRSAEWLDTLGEADDE